MTSPATQMLTATGRLLVDACLKGNLLKTRELIASGADVNRQIDGTTCPPLHAACMGGHAGIAGLLLSARANINQNVQTASGRYSPLFLACIEGHALVVALLLRQEGLDINQAAKQGCTVSTPLQVACVRGHHEVVKLLIQHAHLDINHALVERELEEGEWETPPPLHAACQCGQHRHFLAVARAAVEFRVNYSAFTTVGLLF